MKGINCPVFVGMMLAMLIFSAPCVWSQGYHVIFNFGGPGHRPLENAGGNPVAGLTLDGSLTFDPAGNLYGTASGGSFGQDTVFKLHPSSGGHWTENVYHTFTGGTDGGLPYGGVTVDVPGNLYGAASVGGTNGQNGG